MMIYAVSGLLGDAATKANVTREPGLLMVWQVLAKKSERITRSW